MKRALIVLGAAALLAVAWTSAYGAETYKIGAIFSITGANAPLGVPEKDTVEMIVEQINKTGGINGHKLEAIVMDDAGDETKANLAAKKLIESDKVCTIVGPSLTGTSLAVAAEAQASRIPLISCAAGAVIVTPTKPYVFKTAQSDIHAVAKVIDYLKAHDLTRVAFLNVSNAFGKSGKDQMQKQSPRGGIRIVAWDEFGDKDTNMTAQLTRIRGKNPQAVVCWGTNPGPALVARDMKALKMKMPLIMSHGVANKKFIELAGDAADGVIFPAGRLIVVNETARNDPQRKVLLGYAAAFKKKYGRDPDTFGGHAWDAVMLVVRAMRKVGDDPAKIRDEVEKTRLVGISGVFAFSPTDHNGLGKDAFVMVEIKNGKWKMLT